MRAWKFVGVGEPLVLEEIDDFKAKPGYVTIDVKATGICGSDVHSCTMPSWEAYTTPGCVVGHEICGVVREVGEGVVDFAPGDRVSVCPSNALDGTFPGSIDRPGGFATMHAAPAESLVRIPDNLSFVEAAGCGCAYMTPQHAVFDAAGVEPGMKVGIIGIGGLGQTAVRLAVLAGCEVYASSRKKSARDIAMSLGCTAVVDHPSALAEFNLDCIIDFAGAGYTLVDAVNAVRFQGKVVLVGMAADSTTLSTIDMVSKQVTIEIIDGGTKEGMEQCFEHMAAGEMKLPYTIIDFEQLNEGVQMGFEEAKRGRIVATISE